MFMSNDVDSKPIVLIVDDDPSLRLIICSFAIENGYFPLDASCAEEAKILLKQNKPKLAIIDGYMPGMDGFSFCEYIKTNPDTKDIPVIIITGLDDDKSVRQAYDSGAQEFITKPIHWAVLRHRMALFCNNAKENSAGVSTTPLGAKQKNDDHSDVLDSIAGISQEFQTQIHEIISYARIGKDKDSVFDQSEAINFFSRIEQGGEQLLSLFNSLKDKPNA